jgi:hypothetical protein
MSRRRIKGRRTVLRLLTPWWIVGASLIWVTLLQRQDRNRYVPDSAVQLGDVKQGEVVERRFMVHNPEGSTLKLRVENLSHPGMKIRMPQELVAGATGWITVSWDTQVVQGETTAEVLLGFNEAEPVRLTLSAKVVPHIDVLPYPAVFISGFRDESVTRTLEIVNNDAAPMDILGLSQENETQRRSYSAEFRTLDPGRRYQLNIKLLSTAPTGRSQDVITVLTDHARVPVIRIPVNLLLKDDVYINPDAVDFGEITTQEASPETFLLKTRRRPIKVLSVTADLPFLKVTSATADIPAWTHEFQVAIEGKPARGPFTGTIYIKTDDPSFPDVKAAVEGDVQ